jgi:hypothetical protein
MRKTRPLELKKTTIRQWGFDKGSKAFVASYVYLYSFTFLADISIHLHSQPIMPKPHIPIPTYRHPFPCTRASLRQLRRIWPIRKVPIRRDCWRSAKQIIHRRYEKHIALRVRSKRPLILITVDAVRQTIYKTDHYDQPLVSDQKISHVQIKHTYGSEGERLRDGDNLQNSESPSSIPVPWTIWNASCSSVVHLGSAFSSEVPSLIWFDPRSQVSGRLGLVKLQGQSTTVWYVMGLFFLPFGFFGSAT